MEPSEYGEIKQALGRIEGTLEGFLRVHARVDNRLDHCDHRIRTLEDHRSRNLGYIAGISTIMSVIVAFVAKFGDKLIP